VKVGQQREIQSAQLLSEGLMRVNAVNADAQNLGIKLVEARQVVLKRAELDPSSAGEIENVESQDGDVATQIGELQRAGADVGRQRKVGGKISYRNRIRRHTISSFRAGGSRQHTGQGLQAKHVRPPAKATHRPHAHRRDERPVPELFARFGIR
jgi:hypothetical protein